MVFAGEEHIDLDETRALWEPHSKGTPYDLSKAATEKLVPEANCGDLRTLVVSRRVRTHTYNIDKARQALGYNPVPELENGE
ncbi:hypothetical protein HO133_004700 [Letharia lupina]|uniref:Uncharacterized protein n=1 Tax=Letharia lupina TaxID=560253 RepID=A0A8H6FKV5_9LECA|nr:uncharacterized protein HO133_004700 [Letharia lupina]KAF6230358.1 hypothetical protein HO133_004700 [Letharia lupina]